MNARTVRRVKSRVYHFIVPPPIGGNSKRGWLAKDDVATNLTSLSEWAGPLSHCYKQWPYVEPCSCTA